MALNCKILVVEDEEISRNNVCSFLTAEGFQTEQASDGAKAIEILSREVFSLIITDFVMPRVDGLELLHRVHAINPRTPVLLMSSYPQVNESKVVETGAAGFIAKPLQLGELLSKVRDVIAAAP